MPTKKPAGKQVVPVAVIERRIYVIRSQKVMLSTHLAELYEVEIAHPCAGGKAQPRPLSHGLDVPIDPEGIRKLEITNCDFKLGRHPLGAIRIHRAGRRDVIKCAE